MKFYKNIINKKKPICVWGCGYIGLSTLGYYAKKEINSIGYDVNKELVKNLNEGQIKNDDFKKWIGFDLKKIIKKKKLIFTNSIQDLKKINPEIHFICIPTEKNGKPLSTILLKTLENIKKVSDRGIVIVESTLTPGTGENKISKILKNKLKFAIAPRRDWFVDSSKTLEHMDRVFGCYEKKNEDEVEKILSIVCRKLHKASSHRVAEMVKSFENAYRHVDIALANQLSVAYPDDNIREVLKLVGTKWNIGTFYPGFGSGGYCIPLSSKYVIEGSNHKNKLSILKNTIKIDKKINILIARSLENEKIKKIAVCGISYKANLKVSTLSPVIDFCKYLKKNKKITVDVFDPFFDEIETKQITKCNFIKDFPNSLKKYDCIVFAVDHNYFLKRISKIIKNLKCKVFFDNTGAFLKFKKHFEKNKIKYKLSGEQKWL